MFQFQGSRREIMPPPTFTPPLIPQGQMDFPGLGQLLLLLAPTSTSADLLYFATLFDLDGDGLVSADDVMDAFEEAGTTLSVLQTPANKVC